MSILHIIILGIVEGITEFLPISSTAHLFLSSQILGIPPTTGLNTFIIAIQLGAMVAGAIFILQTVRITKKVVVTACIAFIPTAIIGFSLYPFIKHILMGNTYIIGWALLIGGIVILILDKKEIENDTSILKELSYKDAFLFGLMQTLSFIPGVSRSGALIIGGKLLHYSRHRIVVFTFLLGLPTLFAATIYDLYQSRTLLTYSFGVEILIGMLCAGIVAYLVSGWLMRYISNHSFKLFGWYRIAFGLIILFILAF